MWKGILQQVLPMYYYLVLAFVSDSLLFETTLSVLKQCLDAIKACHQAAAAARSA